MTNLEFYKDEILEDVKNGRRLECAICLKKREKLDCNDPYCRYDTQCFETSFEWMFNEHKEKEPIKLKKWEYDLIDIYCNVRIWKNAKLKNTMLFEMKDKGYFKGVIDTSMTLEEILNNCEVVDD